MPRGVPDFFKCVEDGEKRTYDLWLKKRARLLREHDKRKGHSVHPLENYKAALHTAVKRSGGVDEYSGETIEWHLAFEDRTSLSGARNRRSYGAAPSVDHLTGGGLSFVICRDDTNTAKGCMTLTRFYKLCERIAGNKRRFGG